MNIQKSDKTSLEKKVNALFLILFLYSTFAGVLRKWVVDTEMINNILLLIQLLLPFSFIFFLRNPRVKSPFSSPLITSYAIVLIALALNPMNLTIFHGIFGIITHLGFWFACFFYIYNWQLFHPERNMKFIIIIAVIEILFGAVQYSLPEGSILNKYANEQIIKGIAKAGEAVRITGTFSYLGGFGSFLVFYILMVGTLVRSRMPFYLALLLYLTGLIGCFMSGSRTPTYVYIIMSGLILFAVIGIRKLGTVVLALGFLSILIFGTLYFLSDKLSFAKQLVGNSYENFNYRRTNTRASGEENRRISKTIEDVIFFRGEYPLLGVGLGATYQGATATWGTSHYVLEHSVWLEEEPQRIIMEGGFFLFIFKIMLFIALYRNFKIPGLVKIVLFTLIFLFLPIVFNTYNSAYLFMGLVLLDSSYRRKENNMTVENSPPDNTATKSI